MLVVCGVWFVRSASRVVSSRVHSPSAVNPFFNLSISLFRVCTGASIPSPHPRSFPPTTTATNIHTRINHPINDAASIQPPPFRLSTITPRSISNAPPAAFTNSRALPLSSLFPRRHTKANVDISVLDPTLQHHVPPLLLHDNTNKQRKYFFCCHVGMLFWLWVCLMCLALVTLAGFLLLWSHFRYPSSSNITTSTSIVAGNVK